MSNVRDNQDSKPAVRFKGFSDAWEQRKFFDFIEKTIDFRGRTPKKLGLDWSSHGYPALSALNVKNGYIDFSADIHYGDDSLYHRWMDGNEVHKGDVLFTMEAPAGNVAQVPDNRGYILSQRTVAFVPRPHKMTKDFLAVLLTSPLVQARIKSLSTGGTAQGVSQRSLQALSIRVPKTLEEQNSISAMLMAISNTIALHQRKVENLQKLKKSLLQQMFVSGNDQVPKIRFKGFADAWEERKLGDFIKISREQEVKKIDLHEEKIGYYVLSMRTFDSEGYIDYSKPYWINNFESADDDLFLNRKEFAIIDADMDASLPKIGKVLLNATNNKFLLAAHIRKIKVDVQVDSIFAYALMRTTELVERLKLEANGSISKRLLDKNVYKQKVYLPIHLEEQQQIGEFFWTLEKTIALHQRKVENLQKLKKSLLRLMFI